MLVKKHEHTRIGENLYQVKEGHSNLYMVKEGNFFVNPLDEYFNEID